MAYNMIILHLGDKLLKDVTGQTTATKIWQKLELLYMKKSLANKIHHKGILYSLKVTEDKSVNESIDEFNWIVFDLANIGEKMKYEDLAVMLLNAISKSLSNFVETMKYARDTHTLEGVQIALKAKELESKPEKKALAEGFKSNNVLIRRAQNTSPKTKAREILISLL